MRKQKFIAMLLALAMLLPMLPMMAMETSAAVAEDEDVIRLPITIRDFKQDGFFMQISNCLGKGMVDSQLTTAGTPHYNEKAIDELAGKINTQSEVSDITNSELKSLITSLYNANRTTWNDTSYTWNESNAVTSLDQAKTACQVADWILRNCFVDSTFTYNGNTYDYAKLVPEYDTLVLRKGTYESLATGEEVECYYYNSGYDTSRNQVSSAYKTVFNRSSVGGGEIYNDDAGTNLGDGGYYPLDKALGTGLGFAQEIANSSYGSGSRNHNYHMSTAGSGQFVYHEEEDLFFAFHGDDDVLLFINGILVIDDTGIHGAHESEIYLESFVRSTSGQHYKVSPTVTDSNMTWAEYLGLEEGKLYRFDFFQMERNRTESNFSMYTNMNVVDSSAVPQKKAYLNGQELTYGAFVPQDSEITYGFSLTNNGVTTITDITFEDSLLHVNLNKTTPVIDEKEAGQPLTTYADLEYALYKEGETANFAALTEDVLKQLLTEGIGSKCTLEIRGFKYNVGVPSNNATTKTIPNTLQITALGPSRNNPDKMVTLKGSAAMRVRTLQVENVTFVMDYAKEFVMNNDEIFGTELLDLSKSITVIDEASTGETATETTVKLVDALNSVSLINGNGKYGNMELISNGTSTSTDNVVYPEYDLSYTPTRFINGMDSFLIGIDIKSTTTYENNKTVTSEYSINKAVNVIPANNVYYEDSFVTNTDTGVVGIEFSDSFKTLVGTENNNNENAENYESTTNGGVHGWEDALANDTSYSDGAAHKGEKGATATFTFKGTGVDVYSYTDINSGIVVGMIESTTSGSTFKTKMLMVDNLAVSGGYYNIPTLSFNELPYDEYKVTLIVNSAKAVEKDAQGNIVYDENGNPSYVDGTYRSTYYLDGIRVYNPLGKEITNDTVIDGYLGEGAHDSVDKIETEFENVNALLDGSKAVFTDVVNKEVKAAVYYDSETYKTYGPKNEVYLAKGQAVTFKAQGASEYYIGMKSLTGQPVNAEVTNGSAKAVYSIAHSTDLYYEVVPTAEGLITITNTSDNILALTKVQAMAITAPGAATAAVSFMAVGEEEAASYVATFASLPVEEITEEETEEEIPEEEVEIPEIDVEIENPESEQKPNVNETLKNLVKNLFSKIFGWFGR